MEQVHAVQAGIGQPLDHLQRVAHVQADIGKVTVTDMAQRADHAVQERLAADKAVPGVASA